VRGKPFAAGHVRAAREYGGVLIVEAIVNGVRGVRLMADTGAAWTALTPTSLERVGIDPARPMRTLLVATAQSRQIVPVPTFRIDDLRLGPFKAHGLEVVMLELPESLALDGLLGVNFLDRFRPTFDFQNHALVLRQQAM